MGRKAKVYDEEKIIEMYNKYQSIEDVRLRMGIAPQNIRKILEKNGVEILKGLHRKHVRFGKSIYS